MNDYKRAGKHRFNNIREPCPTTLPSFFITQDDWFGQDKPNNLGKNPKRPGETTGEVQTLIVKACKL